MADPIIAAARRVFDGAIDTLRGVVDGMPAAGLNWQAAGDRDSNSIAVHTTHALHATRRLINVAMGQPPGPRDRQAEFSAQVDGPEPLLDLIDEVAGDCRATLDGGTVDWGEVRQLQRRGHPTVEMSAAFALIHAVEHLRGHADEASLTRHVWLARS